MDFKKGGREYFENMCNGYVSYYRGANPLLFAKRVDIGEIPPGLIFTKCIRCKMGKFQKITYDKVAEINVDDTLHTHYLHLHSEYNMVDYYYIFLFH